MVAHQLARRVVSHARGVSRLAFAPCPVNSVASTIRIWPLTIALGEALLDFQKLSGLSKAFLDFEKAFFWLSKYSKALVRAGGLEPPRG